MTKSKGYVAVALVCALIGCSQADPDPVAAPETLDNTAAPKSAEELAAANAAQAELDAQIARENRIEEVRRRDPAVNWVNIGITTGKFSESIGTSVHKTYEDCIARSAMEDNECFPIAALPASYWNASEDAQPRDSDGSGEAGQTAKQAGPEGRQRGPSEETASPKTPSETPNA